MSDNELKLELMIVNSLNENNKILKKEIIKDIKPIINEAICFLVDKKITQKMIDFGIPASQEKAQKMFNDIEVQTVNNDFRKKIFDKSLIAIVVSFLALALGTGFLEKLRQMILR